ncbi:uncharacterized protein LY89DRAFT_680069 [Mollisia scopiformis]|uniref:Transcription elongation factor Eaf N-terminal domain-containing protein n=1 Tax=Mollisia scopiformis TaxID=149040 RepID=A0A194XTB8_MOLSC|nr:uncharacterized protein LY89DRAFT_680069 [Mollisia scopiformis]KUJ23294.1 hypothetical protein LY89DRAFT_680069 [Mollisia scopiformis]
MAAGTIDIDKPGKYPIVLSDALLGKTSKNVYTGIRYNHKPDTSSDSSSALLQPSSDSDSRYDLTLTDASKMYSYEGSRTSADGQYVLIFDPMKKHFVLHRVDSTFDMNLVSAPWSSDVRDQYPQIEPSEPKPAATTAPQRKASKGGKKAAATKSTTAKASIPRQKVEKPKKAAKPAPPPREPTPEPEKDSDDGLTIEYPDAPASRPSANNSQAYNSTPVFHRNVSEDVSDEDEDAEGEEYEDERERNQDVDHLKLPSPAGNVGGMSDEDIEDELEAELEKALDANESDESEEE